MNKGIAPSEVSSTHPEPPLPASGPRPAQNEPKATQRPAVTPMNTGRKPIHFRPSPPTPTQVNAAVPEWVGFAPFLAMLTDVCTELAQAVVRDGEGVTRFVAIHVRGAASNEAAHMAANTVATSPLVKTAFFGGDANWGRILAAVGRASIQVDPTRTALYIDGGPDATTRLGELQLVAGGTPLPYSEEQATAIFAQPEIDVRIELDLGEGQATVWTSDLSYDYVRINGDYRT